MNVFNQGRKLQELRAEYDTFREEAATALGEHGSKIYELEKALVDMNASHAEEIKELRERLDMPQRRKPTMRPWSMMRSIAEKGEQFIKDKQNA